MKLGRNLISHFGALFTSPIENESIHEIFKHVHWKNFQHILKFHTRPNCDIKLFKCLHKRIPHFSSNFHFGLVNISSKHSSIPLQKNQRWEITQDTIDIKNQQFFWYKRWWTYAQMCWTTFDHCYKTWKHIKLKQQLNLSIKKNYTFTRS